MFKKVKEKEKTRYDDFFSSIFDSQYYVDVLESEQSIHEIDYSQMDYDDYIAAIEEAAIAKLKLLKSDPDFMKQINIARQNYMQNFAINKEMIGSPADPFNQKSKMDQELLRNRQERQVGRAAYFDKWEDRWVKRVISEKIQWDTATRTLTDSVDAAYFFGKLIQEVLKVDISEEKIEELKDELGYHDKNFSGKMLTQLGRDFILNNKDYLIPFLAVMIYELKNKTTFYRTDNVNRQIKMGNELASIFSGNSSRIDQNEMSIFLKGLLSIIGGRVSLENFIVRNYDERTMKVTSKFFLPKNTVESIYQKLTSFFGSYLDQAPKESTELSADKEVNYGLDIELFMEKYNWINNAKFFEDTKNLLIKEINNQTLLGYLNMINEKNIEEYIKIGAFNLRKLRFDSLTSFFEKFNTFMNDNSDDINEGASSDITDEISRILNIAEEMRLDYSSSITVKSLLTLKSWLIKMGHYREAGALRDLLKMG